MTYRFKIKKMVLPNQLNLGDKIFQDDYAMQDGETIQNNLYCND